LRQDHFSDEKIAHQIQGPPFAYGMRRLGFCDAFIVHRTIDESRAGPAG
jgi:hypothetical protein